MDKELGVKKSLQLFISTMLPVIDQFIIKHGDKGWDIFCEKFELSEKHFQDSAQFLEGISLSSMDPEGSTEEAKILMGEFVKRTIEDRPIPPGLQLWVSKGLMNILKNDKTTVAQAFGMKSKPGGKVDLARRLQIACYLKHRKNHVKFEAAQIETGQRFNTDPRNASKIAASIEIPEISDTTLETLSRIDLSPIF